MDRAEFAKHLFAWIDGELDDATAREMEHHVESDPDARRLVEAQRAFGERVRDALVSGVDAEPEVARMLERARPAAARRPWVVPLTRIAAAVMVAVTLGWFFCIGPWECRYLQALENAVDSPVSVPAGFPAVSHPKGAAPLPGACVVGIDYDLGEGRTVCCRYELACGSVAVLWSEAGDAKPSFRRKTSRLGQSWWIAQANGRRLVAFMDENAELLCCVVGEQSEEELLAVAAGLRGASR